MPRRPPRATLAQARYSHFKVGAALETADGTVITGCNIENATYGLTLCAERVALVKALSEGHPAFSRIAVVADTAALTPPCGPCRQLLWEYCGDIEVVLANLAASPRPLPTRRRCCRCHSTHGCSRRINRNVGRGSIAARLRRDTPGRCRCSFSEPHDDLMNRCPNIQVPMPLEYPLMLPTIDWQGDTIVMVDQRKLPVQEIYVKCKSAPEVARAIRTMVIRGAPAIGVAAAMGIALGMRRSTAKGTRQFAVEFQKTAS